MGLIESDWGGTPAQSWTSKEMLQSDPALKFIQDDWERAVSNYPAAKQRYDQQLETWNAAAAKAKAEGRMPPNRPGPPPGPGHPNTPAGVYNGMIAPLAGYCRVKEPRPTRPVPTLYAIGTADPLVPVRGGEVRNPWQHRLVRRPPVAESLERWAAALGCDPTPVVESDAGGVRVEALAFAPR